MKQADIKRLEKAVELYKKIEVVLDKACDSIDNQPREYFYRGEQTTYHLVKEMFHTAISERKYIEGKINAFKEL